MTRQVKQGLVKVPGAETEAHPVRIFPGATGEALIQVLNRDPEFPPRVSLEQYQVAAILPEGLKVFEAGEDMYDQIPDRVVLELWSRDAPFLG